MDHLEVLARREISCLVVSLCRDTIPNVSFAKLCISNSLVWSDGRDGA